MSTTLGAMSSLPLQSLPGGMPRLLIVVVILLVVVFVGRVVLSIAWKLLLIAAAILGALYVLSLVVP